MQSQSQFQSQHPPPHHPNLSRSLFNNPWTLAATTPSTSTSTYWPAFSARSQPPHGFPLPDQSQPILGTRSQFQNPPTSARQGRQTRLGPLDLDRGHF